MEWVNVNVNTPTRVYLGFLFPILIWDYLQVNLINLSSSHVIWCHSIKRFNPQTALLMLIMKLGILSWWWKLKCNKTKVRRF